MALYLSGDDEAAVEAFLAAEKDSSNPPLATCIAAFYRAMSLFRPGRSDEARRLARGAAAAMKPLPKDQEKPLDDDDNSYHDDLIVWMVYKEAKSMIKLE